MLFHYESHFPIGLSLLASCLFLISQIAQSLILSFYLSSYYFHSFSISPSLSQRLSLLDFPLIYQFTIGTFKQLHHIVFDRLFTIFKEWNDLKCSISLFFYVSNFQHLINQHIFRIDYTLLIANLFKRKTSKKN